VSDNTNVNLARLGERYIAMTEAPIAVQFDARTRNAEEGEQMTAACALQAPSRAAQHAC
jgi:hypothetical protein